MGHLDGLKSLGQGADLVDLDQQGVGGTELDALGEALRVGDEEVVADELDLVADLVGQGLPVVPLVLESGSSMETIGKSFTSFS